MPRAQYQLALMLKEGRGVERNYAEALLYFRALSAERIAYAENELGNMYKHGYGVPQDYSKAMDWYWKAAGQDDDVAFANLSLIYEKGLGVSRNPVISYALMKCASSINPDSEVYKDAIDKVAQEMDSGKAVDGDRLSHEICRNKSVAVDNYLK
nr:tetratricopeptide repeat protein [Pseudomonas syringae]